MGFFERIGEKVVARATEDAERHRELQGNLDTAMANLREAQEKHEAARKKLEHMDEVFEYDDLCARDERELSEDERTRKTELEALLLENGIDLNTENTTQA